jgi:hypothetical protein
MTIIYVTPSIVTFYFSLKPRRRNILQTEKVTYFEIKSKGHFKFYDLDFIKITVSVKISWGVIHDGLPPTHFCFTS